MAYSVSRRHFLIAGPAFAAVPRFAAADDGTPVPDLFPTQPADVVKEMVGVAHGNFARVRELVEARPALAKATWDWGFGDWESALDAASHVGNRQIAEYLIANGARPTIFSAAMLGQVDVVKAFVTASPGAQRLRGPHGITLLAHARAGGTQASEVLQYLQGLGDADPAYAPAPLSAAEKALLLGGYVFGRGAKDRVEIGEDRQGFPTLLRPGGTERRLIHLGSLQFHPVGADTVRIRFEMAGQKIVGLTIHDPDLVLTARRQNA
jgi:hypothetical protein